MTAAATPWRRRAELVAATSFGVGLALVAAKIIVGFASGSLGVLSEAAHSTLDVVASAFALVAVRTSQKPPDPEHPYGHGRAENLAAFGEAVLLLVTAAGILYEGVNRLLTGSTPVRATGYALGLMGATLAIELGRSLMLRYAARGAVSQALEAESQ